MSIKQQAEFWRRNIHQIADYPILLNTLETYTEGFNQYAEMLDSIYIDHESFETSNKPLKETKWYLITERNLDNYHNLTLVIDFLYIISKLGELNQEGCAFYLSVQKKALKELYKSSLKYPIEILGAYGFYFSFINSDYEVTLTNCETICVYNDDYSSILPAMEYFAKSIRDYPDLDIAYSRFGFYIANYKMLLSIEAVSKDNYDPLDKGILGNCGSLAPIYERAVKEMLALGLSTSCNIHPYVDPHWQVRFLDNKKYLFAFHIKADYIGARFSLKKQELNRIKENSSLHNELMSRLNTGVDEEKIDAKAAEIFIDINSTADIDLLLNIVAIKNT